MYSPPTLAQLLRSSGNQLSDDDLAALADWANAQKYHAPDPSWKRAYSLIREGSDLLLRRRAGRRQNPGVSPPNASAPASAPEPPSEQQPAPTSIPVKETNTPHA